MAVPFPPGGVSDAAARLVADALTKRLGQQVVVENRPGATGNVAGQHVAKSEPDGYTSCSPTTASSRSTRSCSTKLPFDVTKDFTPIGKIGDYPFLITVNPAVEAKNLQELIALSKTNRQRARLRDLGQRQQRAPHRHADRRRKPGAKLVHVPVQGRRPGDGRRHGGPHSDRHGVGGGRHRAREVGQAARHRRLERRALAIDAGCSDHRRERRSRRRRDVVDRSRRAGQDAQGSRRPAQCGAERIACNTPEMQREDVRARRPVTPGPPEAFRDEIKKRLRPLRTRSSSRPASRSSSIAAV